MVLPRPLLRIGQCHTESASPGSKVSFTAGTHRVSTFPACFAPTLKVSVGRVPLGGGGYRNLCLSSPLGPAYKLRLWNGSRVHPLSACPFSSLLLGVPVWKTERLQGRSKPKQQIPPSAPPPQQSPPPRLHAADSISCLNTGKPAVLLQEASAGGAAGAQSEENVTSHFTRHYSRFRGERQMETLVFNGSFLLTLWASSMPRIFWENSAFPAVNHRGHTLQHAGPRGFDDLTGKHKCGERDNTSLKRDNRRLWCPPEGLRCLAKRVPCNTCVYF